MQNEIIVNAEKAETRVAILEGSTFNELHIERYTDESVMGSVVMGRVTRVLPGMQAAFVDIGLEKAAFLYAGDYIDTGRKLDNDEARNSRRRRGNGRSNLAIDTMLREGQEIVVQIAKEPIGTKGARITSQISIPGRHLVLTPWSTRVGVSRKIGSDRERKRLREIVDQIRPKNLGFIIRTAGGGVRDADIEADVRYLTTVWKRVQKASANARAPKVLYAEPPLPLRMIRDFTGPDTKRIAIDSEETYRTMRDFVNQFVADPKPRLEHYTGRTPIFDYYGLESQIQANLERRVYLKSGGSLIIDQSEALTSIDVNTGRYVGKRNLEETVLKTNLEAVKEIVHQLRFRNIGGIVIMDLIDMESRSNREKVYRALQAALRHDKARTNILKISELGLVEMTRKRTRENLVQALCEPCSYCEGRGYVLSSETVAFNILREVRKDLPRFGGREIAIAVSPQVAEALLSSEHNVLAELGNELGREIEVRARPGLHQEQFEVTALDQGEPVAIPLRWLGDAPSPEETPVVVVADPDEALADAAEEAAQPEATGDEEMETTAGSTDESPPEIDAEPVAASESDGPPVDSETTPESEVETADAPPVQEEPMAFESASDLAAEIEAELEAESRAALEPSSPGGDNPDPEPAAEAETLDEAEESPILRPFSSREGM